MCSIKQAVNAFKIIPFVHQLANILKSPHPSKFPKLPSKERERMKKILFEDFDCTYVADPFVIFKHIKKE